MTTGSEAEQALDVRALLGVVRRRWWVVALVAVVAALVALGLAMSKPDQYASAAQVRITDPNASAVFDGMQLRVDPEREIATQLEVLRSPSIEAQVQERMGEDWALVGGVTFAGKGQTDVVVIRATSEVPAIAQEAANTFADVYVLDRRQRVSGSLTQRAEELRSSAEEIDSEIAGIDALLGLLDAGQSDRASRSDIDELTARKQALLNRQAEFQGRASELDVEAAVREGDVEVISEAELAAVPFAPTPEKDAVLAGILGLLVGLGIVFLLERLDDRIDLGDDVEQIAGAPLLGSVLVDSTKKRQKVGALPKAARHLVAADSIDAEAYRTLATSLRFSSLGREKQMVAITSASGTEGKSTITANLAAALADAGLKVVLVSADLRRPSIGEVFSVSEGSVGLSSVLVGDVPLAEALTTVTLPSGNALHFLASGPVPPNPAELLGSRRMADLLAEITAGEVDYVLLDCPPILPVSDVLALSQFIDGVVLVTVPGRTRAGQLNEAADRLHKVGASVLGVVLNGVPRSPGRYGYYHYYRRYDAGYTARPSSSPAAPASTASDRG